MDYQDKVVVITGGANGIGRALVEGFSNMGAKVAVIDKDSSEKSQNSSGNSLFMVGDISEESVLREFARQVLERFGSVDYLINNACVGKGGLLSGCSYEDFNYVLRVGVSAPYLLAFLFRDSFNEGASILNISSTRAFQSQADTEAYSATKGAILSLTHALAVSLSGKVRVNAISPGWIETDAKATHSKADRSQHPVGRVGRVGDIVSMALFLGSSEAGFITGENIVIDGGMSKLMIYDGDKGWNYSG